MAVGKPQSSRPPPYTLRHGTSDRQRHWQRVFKPDGSLLERKQATEAEEGHQRLGHVVHWVCHMAAHRLRGAVPLQVRKWAGMLAHI